MTGHNLPQNRDQYTEPNLEEWRRCAAEWIKTELRRDAVAYLRILFIADKDPYNSYESLRDEYGRRLKEALDFAVESAWFEVKTAADAVAIEAIRTAFAEVTA